MFRMDVIAAHGRPYGLDDLMAGLRAVIAAERARRFVGATYSSLTVMSGYRFVRRAAERAIPVAIVNGPDPR